MKDIKVIINNHEVGNLFFEKEKNQYGFNYTQDFKPISLIMPYKTSSYIWHYKLHPIFDMNMPEGYLFEIFKKYLTKEYGYIDDFLVFSHICSNIQSRLSYKSFVNQKEFLSLDINEVLQKFIPGQIGRFNDSFNFNCVGDTFQFFGVPTILFEGGHFQNDYQREETRKFLFFAMITAFRLIYENDIVHNRIEDYLNISQNNPVFCDLLYKNIKINYDGKEKIINFAAQYKEEIIDGKVVFNAYIVQIDNLGYCFGHQEFDANGALYSDKYGNFPRLDHLANFCLGDLTFENGLIKS